VKTAAIIIPVRNKLVLTRQCLERLTPYRDRGDFELIVVDDGSTDGTADFLARVDGVRVVRHETSQGFARSCNDGAEAASAEYLVFLNNDTVAADGWLEALIAYAEGHEQAHVVGSKLLYQNQTIQHAGIVIGSDLLPRHVYRGFPAGHPAVSRSRSFQAVTAASMLVRRNAFEDVAGFDADFVNGFDDIDLCLRIGERGGETHYCPESALVHLEAATRGDDADLFRQNSELYLERWGSRVRRDDVEIYAEDGLLDLVPGDLYPLELRVDPLLATAASDDLYDVLEERSRQVFDLLKENAALRVRLGDLEPSRVPSAIAAQAESLRPFDVGQA
jgi:O-antigen biosynthesis protein